MLLESLSTNCLARLWTSDSFNCCPSISTSILLPQARCAALNAFMGKICGHPTLSYCSDLHIFLEVREEEIEFYGIRDLFSSSSP